MVSVVTRLYMINAVPITREVPFASTCHTVMTFGQDFDDVLALVSFEASEKIKVGNHF